MSTFKNILTFPTRTKYRKEIITILLIKLVGLYLIWACCFSHATSDKITSQMMQQHFTDVAAASETSLNKTHD